MSRTDEITQRRVADWLEAPIVGHGLWARYQDAREIIPDLLAELVLLREERDEWDSTRAALVTRLADNERLKAAEARAERLESALRENTAALGWALQFVTDTDRKNDAVAQTYEQAQSIRYGARALLDSLPEAEMQ